MVGKTNFNMGGELPPVRNTNSSLPSSSFLNPTSKQEVAQNDALQAQQAQTAHDLGNDTGAKQSVQNIIDPTTRLQTYQKLFPTAPMTPPSALYIDGSTGVQDPLSLFFMMVLYLDKPAPKVNWGDILKVATAAASGNSSFSLTPDTSDAFLSQSKLLGNPASPTVSVAGAKPTPAPVSTTPAHDASNFQMPTTTAPTPLSGSAGVVVWPIQNMPTTEGLTKSVEWETNAYYGNGDPQILTNSGSSSIDLKLNFVYAVGVPGIGDSDPTDLRAPHDGQYGFPQGVPDAAQTTFWDVEAILGVMYLATSLVYPFRSQAPLIDPATKKPVPGPAGTNQYPVVFLRHYSLFPYLTPFVVKCVTITPDEEQPMIVTDKSRLQGAGTDLTFPAVRQIVRITIDLISAHNYVGMFGQTDATGQLALHTSGKTYRNLAAALLGGRI